MSKETINRVAAEGKATVNLCNVGRSFNFVMIITCISAGRRQKAFCWREGDMVERGISWGDVLACAIFVSPKDWIVERPWISRVVRC
jgi:hypothetical protein